MARVTHLWLKVQHHSKRDINTLQKLLKKYEELDGNKPPSALGKKRRPESIEKLRKYLTGRKRPEITGVNCYNWKGGITPVNITIRMSTEYKLWRKAVFERDNYTCIFCGVKGGVLQVDHIKPFSLYPELRFAIDNGRTLCKPCHLTTDTWGGRINKK